MSLHGGGRPPHDNAPSATLCDSNHLLNQGFLFMVYLTMLSGAESIQSSMLESLVNSELEQHMQYTCNVTISLCVLLSYMSLSEIQKFLPLHNNDFKANSYRLQQKNTLRSLRKMPEIFCQILTTFGFSRHIFV